MDPDNPGGVAPPGVIRHKRQRACAPRSGYTTKIQAADARIEGRPYHQL